MQTTTREWIFDTVTKLPQKDVEQLKDYLEFLTWKAKQQKPEPKQTGKNPMAQRIIEAVEKSHDVTIEDAEALLQVIKENQMPVRFDSPFKEPELLEQKDQ